MHNKNRLPKMPSKSIEDCPMDFMHLRATNHIQVTSNMNRPLIRGITDTVMIQWVLEWLGTQLDGWHVPPNGVPVATVRLNFYQDARFLGNVGIGRTFITAHALGGFCARNSTPDARAALFTQLGLDDVE